MRHQIETCILSVWAETGPDAWAFALPASSVRYIVPRQVVSALTPKLCQVSGSRSTTRPGSALCGAGSHSDLEVPADAWSGRIFQRLLPRRNSQHGPSSVRPSSFADNEQGVIAEQENFRWPGLPVLRSEVCNGGRTGLPSSYRSTLTQFISVNPERWAAHHQGAQGSSIPACLSRQGSAPVEQNGIRVVDLAHDAWLPCASHGPCSLEPRDLLLH